MEVSVGEIPSGKSGTVATIRLMRQFVCRGAVDLKLRAFAQGLIDHLHHKDLGGQVAEVFAFVRDRVRYQTDPAGIEWVQEPRVTLQVLTGDCDDQVVLLAALLKTLGFPTRFVTVGRTPQAFSHVYLEVSVRGRWLVLDPIEPFAPGRTFPGPMGSRQTWEV